MRSNILALVGVGFLFSLKPCYLLIHLFSLFFAFDGGRGGKRFSYLFTQFEFSFGLMIIWDDDCFMQLLYQIVEPSSQLRVSQQFFPNCQGNFELYARNAKEDSLGGHSVKFPAPVAVQEWVSVKFALKSFESHISKNVPIFIKELPDFFTNSPVLPQSIDGGNSHIDFAVVFPVHFPVDIDVEQGLVLVHEGPVVEGLVEGAIGEMFGEQVVGVDVSVVDEIGHPPEHE